MRPVIWLLASTENRSFLEHHWRYWNIWMPKEGLHGRQGSAAVVCSIFVYIRKSGTSKNFTHGTFLVECCKLQKHNFVALLLHRE